MGKRMIVLSTVAIATSCAQPGYVQRSCDASAHYVAIGLVRKGEGWLPRPRIYVVSFDPGGLAINLAGMPYAPPWSDVSRLDYEADGSDSGALSFGILSNGSEEITRLDGISRSCWLSLNDFLRRQHIGVTVKERGLATDGG